MEEERTILEKRREKEERVEEEEEEKKHEQLRKRAQEKRMEFALKKARRDEEESRERRCDSFLSLSLSLPRGGEGAEVYTCPTFFLASGPFASSHLVSLSCFLYSSDSSCMVKRAFFSSFSMSFLAVLLLLHFTWAVE